MKTTILWKSSALIGLALLLIFIPCLSAAASTGRPLLSPQEQGWLSDHNKKIRIGITVIPPQVIRAAGAYEGLSLDYIHLMEHKLGCRFELVPYPTWNDVMKAARARRIDMIFAAQRTPDRLAYLIFTKPYIELPNIILVRKDKRGGSDLMKMKGWRVATSEGSAVHEYLRRNFPDLNLVPVPDELKGIEAVSMGQADAMVVEISRASYYIEREGILNLRVSGDAGLVYRLRFAVRKDWPVLRDILNKGLSSVTSEERRDINQRWIIVGEKSVFASRTFRIFLIFGLGLILAILAGAFLWTRTLRRIVLQRTLQLRQELAERKQVEDGLRVGEERYRMAQRMGHVGNWEYNLQTTQFWGSDEAKRIYGFDPLQDHFSTEEVEKCIPERERVHQALVDLIEAGKPYNLEFEIYPKDASEPRTITSIAILQRDENGDPLKVTGVIQDVTERKRAERDLVAREREYRTLVESVPDFIVRYSSDLRRTYVNPAWEKASGLSASEVIGVASAEVPKVPSPINADYVEKLRLVMETGVSQVSEFTWTNAFGKKLFLEYVIVPEFDRNEKIAGVLSVGHDITEHKQIEQERLANLRFLENMDKVNRAIQGADDLEKMMQDLLGTVLSIFDCDRTFLLYPCDPSALTWSVPMESNKPEYPGVMELKQELPMDPQVAETLRILLAADGPVTFGPGLAHPLPVDASERFGIKCFMSTAIFPKTGKPWQFGIHQCAYARAWTDEEQRLFQEIGRRLADGLSVMLSNRDLLKSMDKLEKAQHLAHIGSWELNRVHNVLTGSDELFRIFEINPGAFELTYQMLLETVHPEDREAVVFAHTTALKTREPLAIDHRLLFPDGRVKYVHELCEIDFKDDKPVRSIGTVQDITKRKKTEAQLLRSERRTATINRIARVFLTVPDEEMYGEVLAVVLETTRSKYGIFGYIDEKGDLVVPSLSREVWSECRVRDKSTVFPAATWGESLWGKAVREKKSFCSDGPFHTPEGHIRITRFLATPIVFGDRCIGQLSVANKSSEYTIEDEDLLRDIANFISPILNARLQRDVQRAIRRNAVETIKEKERFIRDILDSVDEGFIVVDAKYHILSSNRAFCRMMKLPEEEIVGRLCYEAVHRMAAPCYQSNRECPVKDTFETGKMHSAIYTYKDASGAERIAELKSFPIIDPSGTIVSVIETINDVTEKRKLEQQLRQAQKMEAIGLLAGGVAHDFNNKLGVILGHAELALGQVDPSQAIYTDLMEIRTAAVHSGDLTRQLLAFARKQAIAPKVLDLNKTIKGMLKMLRRLIGENIVLSWLPGEKIWPVKIDPTQIDQILANLCINARDAIKGAGRITIETENTIFDEGYCTVHPGSTPGAYVQLALSDNGYGMSPEILGKVFDPFFTTKALDKGTGLGLSTVYGIVKQNQGLINVYSEPGQGTTFKIYLPRHTAAIEPKPENKSSAPVSRGHETILIVEDESSILEMSRLILEKLRYRVLTALSPLDALRVAKAHTGDIHLLLSDVVLPEMDGKALANKLALFYPKIKWLFMSGYTGNAIVHHGVLDEGVHFIQKPFSLQAIAEKVREVLDSV